jgi:flagellar hook-length control protein FliK
MAEAQVSPVIPVSPVAALPGGNARMTANAADNASSDFARVLQDKQSTSAPAPKPAEFVNQNPLAKTAQNPQKPAANAASKAPETSRNSEKAEANKSAEAADETQGAAPECAPKAAAEPPDADPHAAEEAPATPTPPPADKALSPAEMAQMLSAAGIQAQASQQLGRNTPAAETETNDTAAIIASANVPTRFSATGVQRGEPGERSDAAAISSTSSDQGKTPVLPQNPATLATPTEKPAATTANLASPTEKSALPLGDSPRSAGNGNPHEQSPGERREGDTPPDSHSTGKSLLDLAAGAGSDKIAQERVANSKSDFANALEQASAGNEQIGNSVLQQTAASNLQGVPHAAAPQHAINTPVGRHGWAEEVSQQVVWSSKNDDGRADLVLTPPQMGRIEISISLNGDQASASFVAQNPVAREALQDAMPRLREALAQSGIQLGQADVSAGQSGQSGQSNQSAQSNPYGSNRRGGNSLAATAGIGELRTTSWTRQGNGLVDTFA